MRATKTVYLLMAVLILIPWMIYHVKSVIRSSVSKKRLPVSRLTILLAGVVIIAGSVYMLYNFTIGYQAPLVAERAGVLFQQRVEGTLDFPTYMDNMDKNGLVGDSFSTVSGEDLDLAGISRKPYELHVSQRTFQAEEDRVILYLMHKDENESFYSYVKMELLDNRWRVMEHNLISNEDLDKAERNMRFMYAKP